MKKESMLLMGLIATTLSAPAFAGGFIRAEVGQSRIDANVSGLGSGNDTDSAFSLRGGYYFNRNFAIEGFYSQFYDESTTIDDGEGQVTASGKLSGIGLGVVGKTDFGGDGTGFFVSGRAGVMRGKIDVSVTGYGSDGNDSTDPYFGIGAGYDFSPKFGISANLDRHKGSGTDVDITAKTLTVGVELRF